MCSQSILSEITGRVVHAAREYLGDKLDRVILYGSYARGDFDDESDIDILILADIPAGEALKTRHKIRELIGYVDLEYDVLLSLHVTDSAKFNKFANDLPFYMNVLKDGVILSA